MAAFLADLQIRAGRDLASETEMALAVLLAAGLRHDEEVLIRGVAEVRRWAADSITDQVVDEVRTRIGQLELQIDEPGALLVVEAIDDDPHAEEAFVRLDWRDHFPGETPYTRNAATDPRLWDEQMLPSLAQARERIRDARLRRVIVRGQMRLPAWFAVGAEFRRVAGFEVATVYRGEVYRSDVATASLPNLRVDLEQLGNGGDLAVVVEVSASAGSEVRQQLEGEGGPIGVLTRIAPLGGPGARTMAGPEHAAALAEAIREQIRELLRAHQCETLHLFLIAPAPLAMLLGHSGTGCVLLNCTSTSARAAATSRRS